MLDINSHAFSGSGKLLREGNVVPHAERETPGVVFFIRGLPGKVVRLSSFAKSDVITA